MTRLKRQEAKRARRRRRLAQLGPARRHWDRRRAGTANSAPQLRNRPTPPNGVRPGVLEDALLEGRPW